MDPSWGFYLYAIKKSGDDLCATKKFTRICVSSTLNFFVLHAISSTFPTNIVK
jgi:hypothetical protein